jgi:hypothetical protein
MADKTIPELTEATTLTGTAVFPFDSGIQTFRVTATNLAKALAAVFYPVVQTKNVDYQILVTDRSVRMSGDHTATMPDATLCTGKKFRVKKIDGAGTTTSIAFLAGQSADGETLLAITEQYGFWDLESNGTNYDIVGVM